MKYVRIFEIVEGLRKFRMSRSFILIHILQVDNSSQMINRSVIKEQDCPHMSSLNLHQPYVILGLIQNIGLSTVFFPL